MTDYEQLGAFYLGRVFDRERGEARPDLLLYDAKDLCTHGVIVGMTGSGKTGLGIGLIEEAAIDGVPSLVIDPKGDMGNLLLTFPELSPADFEPWIDPGEAARAGRTVHEHAAQVARTWADGLESWGQDGARIARLRGAAEFALYTPGSTSGRPLRLLRTLEAPARTLDAEALGERVMAAASGLLALVGLEADPAQSREHILLANLLQHAWREGRSLDLGALIAGVQNPPFERLGVMDLESFFPARERTAFALRLNALLASPGFAAWLEGEPLDVQRLLWSDAGRPRVSVLSIAHLSEPERMFFVTWLLGELVAWMRTQPGTSSLRALLYMDEVFGYLPPVANPPSKTPLLTLLKQARAYGLGVVLATQNPVDLDYKSLSNAGTWFIGRLQTERDLARVLDGLEGASASSGAGFRRADVERTIAGLPGRVFLLHNVRDDRPELFQTRWVMSYLRGPLTRDEIARLAPAPVAPAPTTPAEPAPAARLRDTNVVDRPVLGPGIAERFARASAELPPGASLVYRPALYSALQLHFAHRASGLDAWRPVRLLAPLGDPVPADPWARARVLERELVLGGEPDSDGKFARLPAAAARATSYKGWKTRLVSALYRSHGVELLRSVDPRAWSQLDEGEGEFRARVAQLVREERDRKLEKLRARYAPKLARLAERIRRAEDRVELKRERRSGETLQTAISLGATVLGALFGRRASASTIGRATTTLRGAGRVAGRHGDVERAADVVEELRVQLTELQDEFDEQAEAIGAHIEPASLPLERVAVRPRKSDVDAGEPLLAWTPWAIAADGSAEPLF